ncbi:MAG: TatD family hydrolase [Pseudomonadota bacterium]
MLIDSHCHLDYPGLVEDLPGVLDRARAVDIGGMVTISTRVRQFEKVAHIAESHSNVWCTVGTHPHNADEEDGISVDELVRLAKHPKVIGIGEAGLDYHYDNASRDAQKRGFITHIEAARETGLPLIVHARSADDDVGDVMETEMKKAPFQAVMHCFSSGSRLAERSLDMGFTLSFSGILTFKNARELHEIAKTAPNDRVLVETDAPFLAPVPMRGKPNEPAYVAHTLAKLSDLRGATVDKMAETTTENFFALFSKALASAIAA